MGYTPGQGAGGATTTPTATPGSSKNKPATGRQKYGVDVVIGHTPGTAYDKGSSSPITADLGDVLQSIYGMKTGDVKHLQDRLVAAGLLSRKAITYGVADEDTVAAYEKLLLRAGYAHNAGRDLTPDQALDEAIAAGPPSLDAQQQQAPFSPQVLSPAEIRANLEQDLPAIMGSVPSDKVLNGLVGLYQSLQIKQQRSVYDTNASGGTSTAMVPLDVFAREQAMKLNPDAVHANDFGALAKAFRASLADRSVDTAAL